MVAAIVPLVAGAYCLVALFYAAMATLGGQGRPAPVALAFFLGAFAIAPAMGYVLTFVVHCCGRVLLYGIWLGLIAGYVVTTLIASYAVLISDWPLLSKQAQERSEAIPAPPPPRPPARAEPSGGGAPAPDGSIQSRTRRTADGMAAPLLQDAGPLPPVPPMPQEPVTVADAEGWSLAD